MSLLTSELPSPLSWAVRLRYLRKSRCAACLAASTLQISSLGNIELFRNYKHYDMQNDKQ
jgi:hypothetical protein